MERATARDRLRRLDTDELADLIGRVPPLAEFWAQVAESRAGDLGQAKRKALASLRSRITQNSDAFLDVLALAVLSASDVEVTATAEDIDPVAIAAQIGADVGQDLAPFLISVLAVSNHATATAFAAHHDECISASLAAAPNGPEHGERANDPATDLASIEELLVEAPEVSRELRAAADDIEAGRVLVDIVGLRAVGWLKRAGELAVDGNLQKRADVLRAELHSRAAGIAELKTLTELLAGAQTLADAGHDSLIPGLLASHGHADLDSLRLAVSAHPATAFADTKSFEADRSKSAHGAAVDSDAQISSELRSEHEANPAGLPPHQTEPTPAAEPNNPAAAQDPSDAPNAGQTDPDPQATAVGGVDVAVAADPSSQTARAATSQTSVQPDPEKHAAPNVPAASSKSPVDLQPGSQTEASSRRPTSDAGGEPAGREGALPDDPWSEPAVPLLANLISSDRLLIALLVAQQAEPEAPRVKALRFFAAAFSTRSDALQFELPDLVLAQEEVAALNLDESRVLLAGHARLALELGYSPTGSLEPLRERAGLQGLSGGAIDECVQFIMRGGRLSPVTAQTATMPTDWRAIEGEAHTLLSTLQSKQTAFVRASKVIHYLARQEQPLGVALTNLRQLAVEHGAGRTTSSNGWDDLAKQAQHLRKEPDRVIDQADAAVSSKAQRRREIVGAPRERMLEAIASVCDLLERASTARANADVAVDQPTSDPAALLAAVDRVAPVAARTTGDAAIERLLAWIRDGREAQLFGTRLSRQLRDELDLLFEIPRDATGAPLRSATRDELFTLVTGRGPMDAVDGYLSLGNRQAAEAVITRFTVERTDALDDKFQRSRKDLAQRHRQMLFEVDHVLGRLRSMNDDDKSRELELQAQDYREPVPDRLDLVLTPLKSIRDEGRARLAELRDQLSQRVVAIQDEGQRARIARLVADEDEALAMEYLSLAESGEDLPVLEPPPGDDFTTFFTAFVDTAASAGSVRNAVSTVAQKLGTSVSTHQASEKGVAAWHMLTEHKQGGDRNAYTGRIADVLRMTGLVPAPTGWIRDRTATRKAGYATYRVTATPIDGSYIPSLGTQAHNSYDITLVWTTASPQRLLSFVKDDDRTRAQIILYFGSLSSAERVELRRLTTRPGTAFSPIVVDNAVIAWLSTQSEPGWKLTQRVTLPFTTLNPYTPFAGGEVPSEVFVGREWERAQIVDPTGPMFVYGGRQLGKSALLRRVERSTTGDNTIAVYIDLKEYGIGDAAAPDKLWSKLGPRLVESGVLGAAPKAGWNADTVGDGVRAWLAEDSSRRLLLLLDEADNFLTADARDSGPTGRGGFPTLQRLKALMEGSQRRFKPVFAGLHQVQRFHDLPNTPVAHGGQDVLIGPLKITDARQLVRDPMHALGFEFEDEETMWRLLLFTNYQASLIQIICEALITHMAGAASLPPTGGRMVISNRHIDEVYAKRQVRENIAQRFRWTINLDPRYRMIALVAAFFSLEAGAGHRFTPTELQDECEYYWPAGFARSSLSRGDFARYLEEMVGLGVLQRRGDQYALRSPNIISLLGSRESIENELTDAADILEVDYEYNPALNRRRLPSDVAGERRSPLSDAELSKLLTGVHAVVGTPALGLDRVLAATEMVANERGRKLVIATPRGLGATVRRSRDDVVLAELATAEDVTVAAAHLESVEIGTVVLIVPAAAAAALPEDFATVELTRWSSEALQSWQDSPFDTPSLRQQLRQATGGWPELVELAIRLISDGSGPMEALQQIRDLHASSKSAAAFIKSTGMDPEVAAKWVEWFEDTDLEGGRMTPASLDDLAAAEIQVDTRRLVEWLQLVDVVHETEDGWILDTVVAEAALRLKA